MESEMEHLQQSQGNAVKEQPQQQESQPHSEPVGEHVEGAGQIPNLAADTEVEEMNQDSEPSAQPRQLELEKENQEPESAEDRGVPAQRQAEQLDEDQRRSPVEHERQAVEPVNTEPQQNDRPEQLNQDEHSKQEHMEVDQPQQDAQPENQGKQSDQGEISEQAHAEEGQLQGDVQPENQASQLDQGEQGEQGKQVRAEVDQSREILPDQFEQAQQLSEHPDDKMIETDVSHKVEDSKDEDGLTKEEDDEVMETQVKEDEVMETKEKEDEPDSSDVKAAEDSVSFGRADTELTIEREEDSHTAKRDHRPSRPLDLMAFWPQGVDVRDSTLTERTGTEAGNGLFAKWPFYKRDFITEYDGTVVHALRCGGVAKEDQERCETSHHRRIENTDWVINGLRKPLRGRGAGSFANDPSNLSKSEINARIVTCTHVRRKQVDHKTAQAALRSASLREARLFQNSQLLPMVALQALRDIQPGEEIFVDYKPSTRKRLKIQNYTSQDYLFTTQQAESEASSDESLGPAPESPEGTDDHSPDGQWVQRVVDFSTEFFTPSHTHNDASQLIGPPKVYPKYGDCPGAWAPQKAHNDDFNEYIEVEFAVPVFVNYVEIYETLTPGSVVGIYLKSSNAQVLHTVYQLPEPLRAHPCARIFRPNIGIVREKCNQVRIELNTKLNPDWSQIDAIKLRGSEVFGGPAFSPSIPLEKLAEMTRDQLVNAFVTLSPIPRSKDEAKELTDEQLRDALKPPPAPTDKELRMGKEQAEARLRRAVAAAKKREEKMTKAGRASAPRATRTVGRSPFEIFCDLFIKHGKKGSEISEQTLAGEWGRLSQPQRRHYEELARNDAPHLPRAATITKHGRSKRQKVAPAPESRPAPRRTPKKAASRRSKAKERVNCLCGDSDSDYDGVWVACDKCRAWSHVECTGYQSNETDSFECHECAGGTTNKN
eukprot:c18144_g1_i1.p1 GENE.c18144_g1_i1~~c18144_g1_i1.p1  ORF type:complete len:940 (-),score=179.60 c18144_g1_i1:36-2855(-)